MEDIGSVDQFTYLSTILSSSCLLDDDIDNRIRLASSAFGRLQSRVVLNRETSTKVDVYKAVCISTLLFSSEAWALYRSHVRKLEAFHIRSLQHILGLTWADRIPHVEILQRTGCFSIEALIIKRQLRWIGHVIHMPENWLPRKLFYGQLTSGYRSCGGQRKRYKNHLHSILKQSSIPAPELESLAACH